jgi:hypothetical protein
LFQLKAVRFSLEQFRKSADLWPPLSPHPSASAAHGTEVAPEAEAAHGCQYAGAAPRLSRNRPAEIASVNDKGGAMGMPRVKRMLPVFGGWLYVVLSVRFGSVWDEALSTAMTRIEPSG